MNGESSFGRSVQILDDRSFEVKVSEARAAEMIRHSSHGDRTCRAISGKPAAARLLV
jgi:hypothetical protein